MVPELGSSGKAMVQSVPHSSAHWGSMEASVWPSSTSRPHPASVCPHLHSPHERIPSALQKMPWGHEWQWCDDGSRDRLQYQSEVAIFLRWERHLGRHADDAIMNWHNGLAQPSAGR